MAADPVAPDTGGPEPYWKCVAASAPQFLVALQFELVNRGMTPLGLTTRELTGAMAAEAIALYACLVIGMFCVFLSGSSFLLVFRNLQIVTVMIGLTAVAYSMGAAVAIQFLAMILITFTGLLMSWKNPAAALQVGSRLVAAYAALAIAAWLGGTPDEIVKWEGDARVLRAGTVYFFILGATELSGLHLRYVPRNRAVILNKLYGMVGKTYP